jgi:hypothetical protein
MKMMSGGAEDSQGCGRASRDHEKMPRAAALRAAMHATLLFLTTHRETKKQIGSPVGGMTLLTKIKMARSGGSLMRLRMT